MQHSQKIRRSSATRLLRAPLLAVVVLILAALALACRSLPKESLAIKLADLAKNAAIGELSRLQFRADLGDGERPYTLVYHHAPARNPQGGGPVVLVHNTPSTLYSWTELICGPQTINHSSGEETAISPAPDGLYRGLGESHDVYAIEIIGHGTAPGDAGPYSFERCALFVEAAIRALGLEKVHLVGSSYGGEFAWRAALNAPELIHSLALLDSSGYPRRDGDWLSEEVLMRENSLAQYGWLLNSRKRVASALEPHFPSIPPGRVDEFFLVCENSDNWRAMIELVVDENGTRADEIPEISMPTLVMWGEFDLAYDLDHYGRQFAKEIPNAELVVIENAGHYPHEQEPEVVLRELKRFYDRVDSKPKQ
jgi:pimeloyl-ACP methyl ester carboxylesterase